LLTERGWETLGFVRLGDAEQDYRLGEVAPWPHPPPGSIRIEGGDLCYPDRGKPTPPRPGLLTDFLRLVDADDARILRFVEKHSPLGICLPHELPHALLPESGKCHRARWGPGGSSFVEPVNAYRILAAEGAAMLSIAAAVGHRTRERSRHQGRHLRRHGDAEGPDLFREAPDQHLGVPISLWRPIARWIRVAPHEKWLDGPDDRRPLDLRDEQACLTQAVRAWCEIGRVGLILDWPQRADHMRLRVGGRHPFAVIALQVAFRCTRSARLYQCEDCGLVFEPQRQRAVVRFCPECRPKASKKYQAQRRRARARSARDGAVSTSPDTAK
jgi:hypothetical protein